MASPTAVRARPGGPQPVAVKRDLLTETLSLDGTVVAQSQETITYPGRGTVDTVKVKVAQTVKAGDVLVDFDAAEVTRALDAARVNLETAQANLTQGQTQAAAREAMAAQQLATDQQRQEQAVLDADAAVRRAQDNLAMVRSGKTAAGDRSALQAALAQHQIDLQRAQRALDTLTAGPDEDALRAARRDVATAEIALTRSMADLDVLTGGPDQASLRAAQATFQRAQTQLQIARAAKVDPRAPDPAVARIQLDGAIQDAELALSNAQFQVTKLKQPPSDIDVQAARQRVQDAEEALTTANAKQAALEGGPTPAMLDDARAAVDGARRAGAQAQASLDQINSHPTPAELADAQEQVRKAQSVLDNARQAPTSIADTSALDMSVLNLAVSQNQAAVATLEAALEATHLKAPFDGTVVVLRTRTGDLITPAKPILILARLGAPIVRVDLDDAQAKRLSAGQEAAIQVVTDASGATPPIAATVTRVTQAPSNGGTGASADLEVNWADGQQPPLFGAPIVALVTVQQKENVLVVPKTAVRQSGGRSMVELQDGSLRRLVNVQIGITTDASVEVLSGLTEGQMVLAAVR